MSLSTSKRYETPNGIFYCAADVDIKATNDFEKHNGRNIDEVELMKAFLKPDSDVIDVGAHIGTVSIPLSKFSRHVYAFEPNPINIELFERNVRENNVNNITLIKAPAGPDHRKVNFVFRPISGQSYVDERDGEVTLATIDELKLAPALIKLDIEGYELQALRGAQETLTTRPVLFFEFALQRLTRAGNTIRQFDIFLKKNQYQSFLHLGKNEFVYLASLNLILGKNKTNNILSVPHRTKIPSDFVVISYFTYFNRALTRFLKRHLTRFYKKILSFF